MKANILKATAAITALATPGLLWAAGACCAVGAACCFAGSPCCP